MGPLRMPGFEHPLRPNTPVLPYGTESSSASFIDPSVRIVQGQRIVVGLQSYIAPYGTLDARAGFIVVGHISTIQDNAVIIANPNRVPGNPGVSIGNAVVISYGATVRGPSTVGGTGNEAIPTYVGPNALIDGATISPGAYVSALARVGPGVTVPSGMKVLPGANVTTDAEASDPGLGKVVPITAADQKKIQQALSDSIALASGYTSLYQGNKATGVSPGTTDPNIYSGDLSTVLGAGPEPGSSFVKFEPSQRSPKFPSPRRGLVEAKLSLFRARIIGGVEFLNQRAQQVAHSVGRSDSIRGDVGQPIVIGSIARLGNAVTMHAPQKGKLTIGQNFRAGDRAVILGGTSASIGDNVVIGSGAVVSNSSIGSGASIGDGAYVSNTTIPAGAVVPPGAILINQTL